MIYIVKGEYGRKYTSIIQDGDSMFCAVLSLYHTHHIFFMTHFLFWKKQVTFYDICKHANISVVLYMNRIQIYQIFRYISTCKFKAKN